MIDADMVHDDGRDDDMILMTVVWRKLERSMVDGGDRHKYQHSGVVIVSQSVQKKWKKPVKLGYHQCDSGLYGMVLLSKQPLGKQRYESEEQVEQQQVRKNMTK